MRPRTSQEKVLITLGGFGFFSILPFGIYRILRAEWSVGIVDLTIASIMLIICWNVFKTRQVKLASLLLALLSVSGALVSIYLKGASQVYWIYPATLASYYLITPHKALFLSLFANILTVILIYQMADTVSFAAIIITQLITNLFAFVFSKNMYDNQVALTRQARKDALTDTGNRRSLDMRLDEIVSVQARSPSKISLIILDLDRFKSINDEYGHRVGDEILIELVTRLKKRLRVTDAIYRFGGEEFVIVPLPLESEKALVFAEELRTLIDQSPFQNNIKVTISIGIAQYLQNENHLEWLERADKALYQAKELGRNRCCIAN